MTRRRAAVAEPLRRVLSALALTVAACAILLGLGVPAASAHDALAGSTPADGATVPAAPAEVSLDFTGEVQELGAQVAVTGPDGAAASEGAVEVDGATVTQPLADDLTAGTYSVAWRVTSADGHPISGTTTFTVAGDTAPGPVQEAAAARPTGSSSSGPWIGVGAAVVLLAALAFAARQLRRRA